MKWIKNLFVFLFLSVSPSFYSQSKVYTFIQKNAQTYPEKDLYFSKVIDARKNRADIGYIYASDRRKKYPADFKNVLPDEFTTFLQATFPNSSASKKIIMVVNHFEIMHQLAEVGNDEGAVKLDVDFYLLEKDSCYFIYHYKHTLQEEAVDVNLSHPNRIKRILLLSVSSMEKAMEKLNAEAIHLTGNALPFDSLNRRSARLDLKADTGSHQTAHLPNYYFFQVGTYYSFSTQVLLFGLTSNLVLQIKKHPEYLIGANLNLMIYGAPSKELLSNTSSYSVTNYDVGLKFLKHVKNQFFINFNPQMILGKVQKNATNGSTATESEKLLGVQVDLGAYLIPPDYQGVYSGLNLFYRGTNSALIGEGFGLKLDLGYRF